MGKDGAIDVVAGAIGLTPAETQDGPRDTIEVYGAVLEERRRGVAPQKARAYAEEGQALALELMGYLVSRYRTEALDGARRASRVDRAYDSGKREDG